jgi:hypothetical protein
MDGQREPVRWRGLKWFGGFLEKRQAEGDTTRGTSECRNILSPRYSILGGMAWIRTLIRIHGDVISSSIASGGSRASPSVCVRTR